MANKSIGTSFKTGISDFSRDYAIVIAIFLLMIIFAFASPYFFTGRNLSNILLQAAPVAIVAMGQALIILTGNFDLSVGNNVALVGIITAYLMKFMHVNPSLAIIVGLSVGTLVGITNGILVAYAHIPAFIATLGLLNVTIGFAKIISNATPIASLPEQIAFIGRGHFLAIPVAVVIMVVLYILVSFASRKTKLGRYIYAIGGSEDAAFFAGIKVKQIKMLAFTMGGFFASVSAIVLISRLDSASITNGGTYVFDSIISCVIGGLSLTGGKGKVIQALFGAVFLAIFFNGMTLLNVDPFSQDVIRGVVFVSAVGIDVFRNRRKSA